MKTAKSSDWKNLIQGFVTNMLEHVGGNLSQRAQTWFSRLKKRTAGTALMILGITFLLTGIAVYANTVLENIVPGIGYVIVGAVIFLSGYLFSKD